MIRFRCTASAYAPSAYPFLGGNSGVEGSYELGIDSIFAVNEEDVPSDAAPSECLSTRTPCYTRLTRRMIAEQEPSSGTQWERPAI